MNKKFENGLFIFRRDLRIIDNNGLNLLSTLCKNIYTIFILTFINNNFFCNIAYNFVYIFVCFFFSQSIHRITNNF